MDECLFALEQGRCKVKKKPQPRVYTWEEGLKHEWELSHSGYYLITKKDLEGNNKSYFFKPYFHESARHGILVFQIAKYIKDNYQIEARIYGAVKPDIIFKVGDDEWAFEIETGINLKKNKKRVLDKIEYLKEVYGRRWFFVVTDRNCLKSYQRLGRTLTKRNICGKIHKIMRMYGVSK